MQITLPRLGKTPSYEPKNVEDDPNTLYGLDIVLHREAKEIFESCKMVVVFLKTQMEVTDFFRMKHALRKKDIFLDDYPNHVMQYTVKDTPLRNFAELYSAGETVTVYSMEPKVAEMLKITKKNPFLSLMGGMIENRFMSSTQLTSYSTLPSKEIAQAMLSATLGSLCSSTHRLLNQNQTLTVNYLSQYIKDKSQS